MNPQDHPIRLSDASSKVVNSTVHFKGISMSGWRSIGLLAVLIGLAHEARGDLAPQRSTLPKPPLVAPVSVREGYGNELEPNIAAKIIIPSSLLPELQESSRNASVWSGSSSNGMTIVAGLFLTAAAISLIFARKNSPHWKKGAVALIALMLLVGGLTLANSFLPSNVDFPAAGDLGKLIVIEVQEQGHEVTLVLPRRPATDND